MENAEKEEILKYVAEKGLVELAKNIIKIPSPSEQETEVAKLLERYMRGNGLETKLLEVEAGRFQIIGRIRGTGGGYSLMFNGHMDTDPIRLGVKDPFTPRIEGRRLYGHGIYNMKAGVAAMVEAAVAIKKSGVKLKGDLVVTPVVGELQGGVGTVVNIKRGIMADFGLVPEPYGEFCCLIHAGVEETAITIRGRGEHVSRMEYTINLPAKMAKVIQALNKMKLTGTMDPRLPGLPRMVIGSVICAHGDDYGLRGACFMPDICTILVNARYLPGKMPHEDITKLLEELRAEDPEIQYEIQIPPDDPELPGMPWQNQRVNMPPQELSPDELIVKVYAESYKYATGRQPLIGAIPVDHPRHPGSYAGNDDAHLTKAGIPSFVCGPEGGFSDEGQQYADIDSMMRIAKTFALTARDICSRAKE